MIARRNILHNRAFAHVFYRCHNREKLLLAQEVKDFILLTLAKNKSKYGVQLFEFNIMDNHIHLVLYADDVTYLGHFMRNVNSQSARFINKFHKRDSQVFRERYKSPLIADEYYLVSAMQYVWLNRYKVNKSDPTKDINCSASWRVNPALRELHFKHLNAEQKELLDNLLDSYDNLPLNFNGTEAEFVREMLKEALEKIGELTSKIFENFHTVGSKIVRKFRAELMSAFSREHVPIPPWSVMKRLNGHLKK